MTNFWRKIKNMFGLSEKKDKPLEKDMESKLLKTIKECKEKYLQAEEEIKKYKKITNETINSTYKVPRKYWYEEIKYYEEIKNFEENKNLSISLIEECDLIVNGYKNEIAICEVNLEFFKTLENQYKKDLKKLKENKKLLKKLEKEEIKIEEIKQHKKHLEEIQYSNESLEDNIKAAEYKKLIENDLKNINQDLEDKQEYYKQLEIISTKYKDDINGDKNEVISSEINSLINEIKNKKRE